MIYCVFTGCGKTSYAKTHANWVDVDTSGFWNINSLLYYVSYLLRFDYNVLVSTNSEILKGLKRMEVPINIVLPEKELRDEVAKRVSDRGDPVFAAQVKTCYYDWWEKADSFEGYASKVYLKSGQFLGDILSNE